MSKLLRLASALVVALMIELAGARAWWRFGELIDPLLVVAIWFALPGRALPAQLGGAAAGLLHDVLVGAMIGLHGFADTLVGFIVARGAQRLLAQQTRTLLLMFGLAAALQQATVFILSVLLLPEVDPPDPVAVLTKLATTAVLGFLLVHGEAWIRRRLARRRRLRGSQLHFE